MPESPAERSQRLRIAGKASGKSLTPAERSQRASIAALERWSREDPKANAERAQAGLVDKFRREVLDEFPGLQEPELSRRAEARRKAHMTRMSFLASKARRAKAKVRRHTGLLSVAEVAELLSRSKVTVYKMIRDGELPAVQSHGRISVRESDLKAYIEALPAVAS